MAQADPLAQAIRRETEALIGKLVMQNTTLTAQLHTLAEMQTALSKELEDAKAALDEFKKTPVDAPAKLARVKG